MSVVRFSSLPNKEAILRASSVRDSRVDMGGGFLGVFHDKTTVCF